MEAAKKVFETTTGKKKPSETFLGVVRTSSGLESALSKLDAALAKKVPQEVARAKDDYHKTFALYYATMLKGAKAEKNDQTYQQELVKLNVALNAILREAAEAERALATDPKTLVTIEEAIGADARATLAESQLLTHPALVGWLNDAFAGAVKIGTQGIHDASSIQARAKAKLAYQQAKQQYDVFKALLPKQTERAKGVAVARQFIEKVREQVTSIQEGLDSWFRAQQDAFQTYQPGVAKERAEADFREWRQKSPAWKHAEKLAALWPREAQCMNGFRQALRRAQAA